MQRERKKRGDLISQVVAYLTVILSVVCVAPAAGAGQHFTATVVKIVDGDSIQVRHQGRSIRVRLWGIDTPEWRQPFSKAAKKYTAKLVGNTEVTLEEKDWDDYGRMVALVTTDDNRLLNEELLKAGLAWVHIYYCKEAICDKWYGYDKPARKRQIGLWYDKEPVPPWVWKRKKRK